MEHVRPADIERTSMEIIDRELRDRGIVLPEENAPVIRRVIHTTADFDYTENLRFTPGAVRRGVEALLGGAPVVTDTNMALAGLSRPGLGALGCESFCYMAHAEVIREARERGTTRAWAAAELASHLHPGCVYAVGNAPTALLSLIRQMESGFRPALILGVPVGFVNVVEAKEALWETCRTMDVPAIVAMGRKGGSTVAAAICNGLIYQAANMLDPEKRGW